MKKAIDTEALAALSRLSFSPDELCALQKDMESILSFFERISKADECTFYVENDRKNVLRSDDPVPFEDTDALPGLSQSASEDGYIVPKAVEE